MADLADTLGWDDIPVTEPGQNSVSEEAPEPDEPQEEPTEEVTAQQDERPRDEQGRFTKVEQQDEEESPSILDKYGGDVDKALAALDQSQRYIGDLHREQGELRQQLAELTQVLQNPRPQQDFESLLADSPQKAAQMALAAGDWGAYNRAKEEWDTMSPGAPEIWEHNMRLQQAVDELRQQIQATQQPLQEQAAQQALSRAYQSVASQNADFESLRPTMSQVVGELSQAGYDWITPALESGDPAKAQAALSHLVEISRARSAGNLTEQAREAARAHVEETERAKQEAIVASASTTLTDTQEQLTPGQVIWNSWAKDRVLEEGWLKPG